MDGHKSSFGNDLPRMENVENDLPVAYRALKSLEEAGYMKMRSYNRVKTI